MNAADQILVALSQRPDAPAQPAEFLRWCNEVSPDDPPRISRFLFALFRSRADLQEAFLGIYLDPLARDAFLTWAHHFAEAETGAPRSLIPRLPAEHVGGVYLSVARVRCVGVLGYLRAVHGLGAAARRMVELIELAGEDICTYTYDHTLAPRLPRWDLETRLDNSVSVSALPDVLLSVLAPHELARVPTILGDRAVDGALRIALCFWETETLPSGLAGAFSGTHEVWVTSEFTARAIREAIRGTIPVLVMPIGASLPTLSSAAVRRVNRASWSARLASRGVIDTTTVVAQIFDYSSGVQRKNPLGLARVWRDAFPDPDPGAQALLFKTVGSSVRLDDATWLREQVAALGRTDICFVDEALPTDQQSALFDRIDVVVSLHRAEGYGLVLLEAMYRNIPVVASAYSGNLAFMNDTNSWMVPCTRTILATDDGPYPAGSQWGEPDHASAVAQLSAVVRGLRHQDSVDAQIVSQRVVSARLAVSPLIDGSAAIPAIRQRLAALRSRPHSLTRNLPN